MYVLFDSFMTGACVCCVGWSIFTMKLQTSHLLVSCFVLHKEEADLLKGAVEPCSVSEALPRTLTSKRSQGGEAQGLPGVGPGYSAVLTLRTSL